MSQGSMTSWSDIIRQQGEESRRRADEALEEMREGYNEFQHRLAEMPNLELLDWFRELNRKGSADPRVNEIWQNHEQYAYELLKGRLK